VVYALFYKSHLGLIVIKQSMCAMLKKVYISKTCSIVVDVCACDGHLLDKRLCVKCALRIDDKHRMLGP